MMSIGLRFVTPFHLTKFAFSPLKLAARVYGVFGEKWLEPLAKLVASNGCEHAITVYGVDGLDEVSIIGPTKICEVAAGREAKAYSVDPEDFGLKRGRTEEILGRSLEQNALDLLNILYGRERGAKLDMVLANNSVCLTGLGLAKSLKDGTELALQTIKEGKAAISLQALADFHGGTSVLDAMLESTGLERR